VVTAQQKKKKGTAQRQQQKQQHSQISSPAHDDLQDPVTQNMGPVNSSSYKWVAAYRRAGHIFFLMRAGHNRLPRSLCAFGERLLHAGVKVGARRMLSSGRREPALFVCPAQQCQQQPQLETLTHLFVECPVAAAVWQWFAQLWQLVQPGAVVPVSSIWVLLLDDDSVWAPPMAKQQLLLLRGCFSRSCLHGPAMVPLHKGCRGVGVTTGCPIPPLDLFME
jgi:hypothetical protein